MPERRLLSSPNSPGDVVGRERLIAKHFLQIVCVLMFFLQGCALYSPYQVFRFTGDYNTERRPSLQAEVFEHLPSHPVRVRLNQWAYNVGPQISTSSIPIPANSPVAPAPMATPGPPQYPGPNGPALNPGGEPPDADLLDEARPPDLLPRPPLPRTDLRSEEPGTGRFGPSARANGKIRGASYEVPVPQTQSVPDPPGAWLFGR